MITVLAGCTAAPLPAPTPTAVFMSEEEAFAAAEETYEAYIDALNQVDFATPATFEPVYALLSGTASESTRTAFSEFHAKHVRMTGATRYDSFTRVSADLVRGTVNVDVCVDVSEVDVLDASGTSIVSADRPPRQPMRLSFVAQPDQRTSTISEISSSEGFTCAP